MRVVSCAHPCIDAAARPPRSTLQSKGIGVADLAHYNPDKPWGASATNKSSPCIGVSDSEKTRPRLRRQTMVKTLV